jgi:hypothetical protein
MLVRPLTRLGSPGRVFREFAVFGLEAGLYRIVLLD